LDASELRVASASVADALDAPNIVDVVVKLRLAIAEVVIIGVLVAVGRDVVCVLVAKGTDDTPALLQISVAMEKNSYGLVSTSRAYIHTSKLVDMEKSLLPASSIVQFRLIHGSA